MERGMTRTDLAAAVSDVEAAIGFLEVGSLLPATSTVAWLAEVLECQPSDFYTAKPETPHIQKMTEHRQALIRGAPALSPVQRDELAVLGGAGLARSA
jgi:hypothetical protein